MVKYSLIKQIGGGPRGVVYKSTLEGYDGYVAIKKVLRDRSCESLYSMVRELVAFKRMDHEHILKMISAWTESATISLALEYMPYDLTALLLSGYKMCDKQIASIAYQIIDAVSYMHTLGIIHRDIKPSNILIDQAGRIKVSDFGMSRDYAPRMSPGVCSLWYRAPELLLGDNEYDDKIDSWSVGCVIVELKTGRPFFNSRSEITQVEEIFKMLGCPEDRYPWSEFISFETYRKEGPWEDVIDLVLGEYFDTPMRKVLAGLLRLDKGKRISLSEAKKMPGILAGKDRFFSVVHKECHEYDVSADYYK